MDADWGRDIDTHEFRKAMLNIFEGDNTHDMLSRIMREDAILADLCRQWDDAMTEGPHAALRSAWGRRSVDTKVALAIERQIKDRMKLIVEYYLGGWYETNSKRAAAQGADQTTEKGAEQGEERSLDHSR